MSLLSSRRRKLLFAAAAVAASGYASYHICTSNAFKHQRKRLLQILSTLSFCCEAVSQSAESLSILSRDLKSFLLSDDDTVPQSLKQAFKVGQSEEFQESVTVLSAALVRGLQRGIKAKPRKESLVRGGQFVKPSFQGRQGNDIDVGSEDVACREIREVSFTSKRQEQLRVHGPRECILFPSAEKRSYDCHEWEIKSYSSGSDRRMQRSRRVGVVFDRLRRSKPPEGLFEKLLSKLFSEPGIDFTSAVTGAFARNLVLAFFDVSRKQSTSSRNIGSTSSSNCQLATSRTEEESVPTYAKVIDLLSTNQCRTLVSECMQTFISTAVTVYVDKTKDVNVYHEVVAGITNPAHKDSMREMLMSICNGAIETLVRTSYNVWRDRQGGVSECHQQAGGEIQDWSSLMPINGQMSQEEGDNTQREALTSYKHFDTQATSFANDTGFLQESNTGGAQTFMDGVSKTLAIPSNRKLIVDVAGTMTSEAVRSFVNVVVSTASSHISSKMHGSLDMLRNCVSNYQGLHRQERSRDMAAKTYVFASVCLAICLHILAGSQVMQT